MRWLGVRRKPASKMYPKTNYEMTPADLEKILDACKPVPMIMLQCGPGRSQQDRANDAWAELGARMGFDHMTVQPTGNGDRFFTAVPSETDEHKKERLAREAEEKRLQEIETLKAEITERQTRLEALSASTPNDQAQRPGDQNA